MKGLNSIVATLLTKTLFLTATLLTANVWGQTFQVPEGGLLRLPNSVGDNLIEKLSVAKGGKLMVPASISTLVIEDLQMAQSARISIAPRDEPFVLTLKQARFADGSVLAAVGSHGDVGVPGGRGTDLKLTIDGGTIANLVIDVSGGKGGDGWAGAQGQDGKNAACWGFDSSAGTDGGHGSNGMPGGDGGNIDLSLAQAHWLEVIDVRQQGGQGGQAGAAGLAGKGGHAASCWLYSLGKSAADGQAGTEGKAAEAGNPGILRVR
ncbi:MAG: hypothetical protein ACRBBW_12410 [Cellvibrionaceae bacterium]